MLKAITPLELAARIRRHSLEMTHKANSSHVGSCLSTAELLAVLYGKILHVNPLQPTWPERDRFILSKGHGCAAYYAVLAEVGFFPAEWLDTFKQNGS
jgi:transketolase